MGSGVDMLYAYNATMSFTVLVKAEVGESLGKGSITRAIDDIWVVIEVSRFFLVLPVASPSLR